MKNIDKLMKTIKRLKRLGKGDIQWEDYDKCLKSLHSLTLPMWDKGMKPKTKDNYIGLELECVSLSSAAEVFEYLHDLKLDKYVDVTEDASISYDDYDGEYGYEFRVLFKEKEINTVLNKFGKFLSLIDVTVNNSCGLHVHLDMRNRDVKKVYGNLLGAQDLLFSLVDNHRRKNSFCSYTVSKYDRYQAINYSAYSSYKTIEIRLHQATKDVNKIKNWIKFLLLIVNSKKNIRKASNKESLSKTIKVPKRISSYIDKTYVEYKGDNSYELPF